MDMLWYGHKHGFVPEADFDLLWNTCKVRYAHPMTRGKWTAEARRSEGEEKGDSSSRGSGVSAEVLLEEENALEDEKEGGGGGDDDAGNAGDDDEKVREEVKKETTSGRRPRRRPLDARKDPPACVAAHRRFLIASSDAFSQDWKLAWLNDLSLYGPSAAVRNDIPAGTFKNIHPTAVIKPPPPPPPPPPPSPSLDTGIESFSVWVFTLDDAAAGRRPPPSLVDDTVSKAPITDQRPTVHTHTPHVHSAPVRRSMS